MTQHDTSRREAPQSFRALKRSGFLQIEQHFGFAGKLQHVARFEVREQQPRVSVDENIAERVEERIAREIRNGERAVLTNAHEARLATAIDTST